MRRRATLLTLMLLGGLLAAVPAGAANATCNGKPVTHTVLPGGDRFDGTGGPDVILGTPGPDVIYGLGGDDTICGLGGDDLLLGGRGNDVIFGDDGNDKLRGAAGDDELHGGAGSDRLLPETGNDLVDGGPGSDIVDYLAADGPVMVDLGEGTSYYNPPGEGWFHTLVLVEKVDGSRFDDHLYGNSKRNVLRGKQGDDWIEGVAGDDDLIGGTGADTIWGGGGSDLVKGQADDDLSDSGPGNDRLLGGGGDDDLYGGDGDDVVRGGPGEDEAGGGPGWDTCIGEYRYGCEPFDWTLDPTGVGPARFGQSATRVLRTLAGGVGRPYGDELIDSTCGSRRNVRYSFSWLIAQFRDDVFVGYAVLHPDLETPRGIAVGSSAADVEAAYPEAVLKDEDGWTMYTVSTYRFYTASPFDPSGTVVNEIEVGDFCFPK